MMRPSALTRVTNSSPTEHRQIDHPRARRLGDHRVVQRDVLREDRAVAHGGRAQHQPLLDVRAARRAPPRATDTARAASPRSGSRGCRSSRRESGCPSPASPMQSAMLSSVPSPPSTSTMSTPAASATLSGDGRSAPAASARRSRFRRPPRCRASPAMRRSRRDAASPRAGCAFATIPTRVIGGSGRAHRCDPNCYKCTTLQLRRFTQTADGSQRSSAQRSRGARADLRLDVIS